ncbi:hypothetical protein C0995_001594 [Termitomyces sp. Mi166|nr:hypothetical protein C0995_001594 [Termitomyces sp. Mi166\
MRALCNQTFMPIIFVCTVVFIFWYCLHESHYSQRQRKSLCGQSADDATNHDLQRAEDEALQNPPQLNASNRDREPDGTSNGTSGDETPQSSNSSTLPPSHELASSLPLSAGESAGDHPLLPPESSSVLPTAGPSAQSPATRSRTSGHEGTSRRFDNHSSLATTDNGQLALAIGGMDDARSLEGTLSTINGANSNLTQILSPPGLLYLSSSEEPKSTESFLPTIPRIDGAKSSVPVEGSSGLPVVAGSSSITDSILLDTVDVGTQTDAPHCTCSDEASPGSTVVHSRYRVGGEVAVPPPSIRERMPEAALPTEHILFPSITQAPESTSDTRTLTDPSTQMRRRRLHLAPDTRFNRRHDNRRHARNSLVESEGLGGRASRPNASQLNSQAARMRARVPSAPANSSTRRSEPLEAVDASEAPACAEQTPIPLTVTIDGVEGTTNVRPSADRRRRRVRLVSAPAHLQALPLQEQIEKHGSKNAPNQRVQSLRDAIHRHLGLGSVRRASRQRMSGQNAGTSASNITFEQISDRETTPSLSPPANLRDIVSMTSHQDLSSGTSHLIGMSNIADTNVLHVQAGEMYSQLSEVASYNLRPMDLNTLDSSDIIPKITEAGPTASGSENAGPELQETRRIRRPHSFSYSRYSYDSPLTSQWGLLGDFHPIYDEHDSNIYSGLPPSGPPSQQGGVGLGSTPSLSQFPQDAPLTSRWETIPLNFCQTREESQAPNDGEMLPMSPEVVGSLEMSSSTSAVENDHVDMGRSVPGPVRRMDRPRRSSGIPVPSQHNAGETSFVAAGILNFSP